MHSNHALFRSRERVPIMDLQTQFNSRLVDSGTCRCWGPDSYRPNIPCFDSISTPSHITAVDTSGMSFSQTCGTCLLVTCINGVTRGSALVGVSLPRM